MRYWLPALFTLSVFCPTRTDAAQGDKSLPASDLLPDGSQLHGVVIPRHNQQRQLVSALMADVVTMVNDEMIAGTGITVDFYGDKGRRDARIQLKEATFNQVAGIMHATETVTIDANTYRARGTGLHFALRESRGFLTGPTMTWMDSQPETAMNTKTSSLIGAAGIALVSQTVTPVNAEISSTLDPKPVQAAPAEEGPIAKAREEAGDKLKQDIKASSTTDAEVREFIERIPLDFEKLTGRKPTPAPAKPLQFEPGPEHTVVECQSGMYFDAEQGLLVYLKDVGVKDPRYTLSGADILKIYMGKAEKKGADTSNKKDPDGGPVPDMGGNFDSVEKIVATGAVRILQRAVKKGKQPVEASGAVFSYHPATGDILLSGGYPWVKQGDFFARAKEPNLTLRMKKDGSFVTEGNWEMGGRLNQR